MFNFLTGLLFIVGGLSGLIELRGTGSSEAIVALGAELMIWGLLQMIARRRRNNSEPSDSESETTP